MDTCKLSTFVHIENEIVILPMKDICVELILSIMV